MRKSASLAAFLATALLLPSSDSIAQDAPTYRAGLKSFTIPLPSSELVEAGPDYRVLLEPLVPINNRLVAAFLQPADLDTLRSGPSAALGRYALVEIPRRVEFSEITPELFKQITDTIATQFGAAVDASLKDQQDEANRRLKALGSSADITFDKPVQLGTLFSKPDASGYGMIMPVSVGGKTKKMIMGMIVVHVQARVLLIYLYGEYKDQSSLDWIRTTDEHWADAILQANH
ncbi:MAG TPA: hypothetical protein VGI45_00200 [Terracidiphilus sp.]